MKGGLGLRRKIIDGGNLPSVCCVYEKQNVAHTEELSSKSIHYYKFRKLKHSTRIVKTINLIPNKPFVYYTCNHR